MKVPATHSPCTVVPVAQHLEVSPSISNNKAVQSAQVVQPGMVIDKVRIRYRYDGSNAAKDEYGQVFQFKSSVADGSFGKKGKFWLSSKAALTCMRLPIGEQGGGLFVQFGCVHKKLWSWVEFNPAKLSEDDMLHISACLDTLFNHGALTLLQKGRLARLDIAIDVRQARMQDYFFLDGRLRNIDLEYKAVGSIYLGSEHGKRTLLIYDKAKEQLEKAGIDHGCDWMRIEARICSRKSALCTPERRRSGVWPIASVAE